MIFIFCGVNWPATYSVGTLFKSHLEQAGHSAAICQVAGLDDVGRKILHHSEEVLLLVTRWMSLDLIDAFGLPHGAPIVFVEASSSSLFSHWLEHTDNDPIAALRETTRDLAPLGDLLTRVEHLGTLNVFTAHLAKDHTGASGFIRNIAKTMHKPIDIPLPKRVDDIAWPDPTEFVPQNVGAKEVSDMLDALDANLSSMCNHPIEVPTQMFSQPGFLPLQEPIDLTGGPRGLFFGPLIHLKSGAWTVTASLLCNAVTQRPKMEFEAVHLVDGVHIMLGRSEFNLIPSGRIRVSLTFVNTTPHHSLEFRLNLTQGVFNGTVAVEKIILCPSSESGEPI